MGHFRNSRTAVGWLAAFYAGCAVAPSGSVREHPAVTAPTEAHAAAFAKSRRDMDVDMVSFSLSRTPRTAKSLRYKLLSVTALVDPGLRDESRRFRVMGELMDGDVSQDQEIRVDVRIRTDLIGLVDRTLLRWRPLSCRDCQRRDRTSDSPGPLLTPVGPSSQPPDIEIILPWSGRTRDSATSSTYLATSAVPCVRARQRVAPAVSGQLRSLLHCGLRKRPIKMRTLRRASVFLAR
jgi:hypothetical protein